MLRVLTPGLQTTLQGQVRIGFRHFGVPYAGPADSVSAQLANRLVANALDATCLEISYGGFEAEFIGACSIAITGAVGEVTINGAAAPLHRTWHVKSGDIIQIAPPSVGCRAYLAIHSGFQATTHFGSTSTYLPAGLGGHEGRALRVGDRLTTNGPASLRSTMATPAELCPTFTNAFAIRACAASETDLLDREDDVTLFGASFIVGRQATRMGISLTGHALRPRSDGLMKSAPVFPGTVQCPPSGVPIVLLCDAQTTGGYPRIANIARCDRHLLGQIRPGDRIQLLHRSPEAARTDFQEKTALLNAWLNA